MTEMALKDMIEFVDDLATDPRLTPQCVTKLHAVSSRLQEMFRLRGLLLNCPDTEEDMAQRLMKCLDLRSGS